MVAQNRREKGIALSDSRQRNFGGRDEEGELVTNGEVYVSDRGGIARLWRPAEIDSGHHDALGRQRKRTLNSCAGTTSGLFNVLGQDVEITVRQTRKEHGQASIVLF